MIVVSERVEMADLWFDSARRVVESVVSVV